MTRLPPVPTFPVLLQEFFCKYLVSQRAFSPQTVAAYRDTFRILLRYIERQTHKHPADLVLSDLDAPCIVAFLDHLEKERKNTVRSRNARLAAIRGFLKYAAARDLASLPSIQRVLAIPFKRFDRPLLGYLSRQEMQAILDAPSLTTFSGHRDRVLFSLMYNTGARVSEIAALKVADISLDGSSANTWFDVRCFVKLPGPEPISSTTSSGPAIEAAFFRHLSTSPNVIIQLTLS
jgi:site-specific recombinase XerD